MKWFRFYSDALDDDKLRLLAFEDRWHFTAVLCMKASGLLDEPVSELRDRRISVKLGLTLRECEEVRRRLAEVNLIRDDWQPVAWDRRQYEHGSSSSRTKAYRERQKEKREQERQEASQERHANVTVTSTEAETEAETELLVPNGTSDLRKRSSPVPVAEIVDLYHQMLCPPLPKVEKITKTRQGYIAQRWREDLTEIGHWRNFFKYVATSDFLMGRAKPSRDRPPFRADLEWLTRPANYAKIAEEKYHGSL